MCKKFIYIRDYKVNITNKEVGWDLQAHVGEEKLAHRDKLKDIMWLCAVVVGFFFITLKVCLCTNTFKISISCLLETQ